MALQIRTTRPHQITICLLAALTTTTCGGTGRQRTETTPQTTSEAADLEALYRARTDSARMGFTYADIGFMTGMIGHHAQALVIAGLSPTHGANPAVQTLSARIINAQNDEIATMQHWLRDRGLPVPQVDIAGTNLMVHGPGYATSMPGMLTRGQIQELDDARGLEFDRLFLTYMIQHHNGAVVMVRNLFGTDGAAQDEAVFKIASDIQVDQITEVARMRRMLGSLRTPGRI